MDTEGKQGGFRGIFIVMIVSLLIAFFWDTLSFIKNGAHAILNPTAGVLLNWNLTWGMIIIVLIIAIFMTLIQKYATDQETQETLREMKKEQKALQEEMKKYREHPEKMVELQKKQFGFMPKMMKLSMRPMMYTAIPLILFFRWFMDFFAAIGDPRFFGFLNWFWFYLIGSILFSSILRKVLKVA
jgi:uncharacterized membrane protein (DUF106 family)